MPRAQFLLWSAAGTALWTTILAFGGWGLGRRYERLGTLLHEIATAVFACIALVIVVRAIRIRGARRGRRSSR